MRIRSKLFLVMLLNSILLVVTMYALIQWTVDKELIKYINIREQQAFSNISERLSEYYDSNGGWESIVRQPRNFHRILRQADDRRSGSNINDRRPPPPEHRRPFFNDRPRLYDKGSQVSKPPRGERGFRPPPPKNELDFSLLNQNKQVLVGRYRAEGSYEITAIESGAKTVGWLAVKRKKHPGDDFDLDLQESLTKGFLFISALVIFISAAFAIPLTRLIVKRIKAITDGARAISSGDLAHRVVVTNQDEISELGRDFNHLAQTLEQNESVRKRWIADISHELRTPLAITSGELEAMEDGIRPLNIENIKSARDEIKHLQRLVNDLYELTNADIGAISYHKTPVDLTQLIQTEGEHFSLLTGEHGLNVNLDLASERAIVFADASRLKQLIQNILGNSLKYTDAPGEILITLKVLKKEKPRFAMLVIEDSSPGVDASHFEKLFDQLYQVAA